jgi:hypothetical protein
MSDMDIDNPSRLGYDWMFRNDDSGNSRSGVYTRSERGHRPHVHVFYGGAEVVIFIGPRSLVRENAGMKRKDIREAQLLVSEHHVELMTLWIEYNG